MKKRITSSINSGFLRISGPSLSYKRVVEIYLPGHYPKRKAVSTVSNKKNGVLIILSDRIRSNLPINLYINDKAI